jgi:hypothetical protein
LAWQTVLLLSVVGAVVCTISSIRGFGYLLGTAYRSKGK